MKKTPVVPGKPIVMKTREDEEQLLMDWVNMQSMYSDSIRYLIQKEIAENGLRNLQLFIPQFRTIDSLKTMSAYQTTGPVREQSYIAAQSSPNAISANVQTESVAPVTSQDEAVESTIQGSAGSDITATEQSNGEGFRAQNNISDSSSGDQLPAIVAQDNMNEAITSERKIQGKDAVASESPQKRKGKKKFGSDVIDSFAN
ncbi:hypothetical protein ACLBWT_18585 [Paenibacillus sp. D51F]